MRGFYLTLLITIGVGLTALADIFLKKAPNTLHWYTLAGALLYCSVAIPVVFAFRLTGFGALFIIWEAAYVIAGIVLGGVLFHESFTVARFFAVVFAISAAVLAYR
jgi:hypothetical protein